MSQIYTFYAILQSENKRNTKRKNRLIYFFPIGENNLVIADNKMGDKLSLMYQTIFKRY